MICDNQAPKSGLHGIQRLSYKLRDDTYKYVHGLYDCARPILTFSEVTRTRGHLLKLRTGISRLNVRKYFFSQRIVTLWNSLPEEVVTPPSINSFKARLDRHWDSLPTKYDPASFQ